MVMREKFILVALLLCFASLGAYALDYESLNWSASSEIILNKEIFSPDENISGIIKINNTEDYPLAGGKIVLHIADGNYYYPSQFNNEENILREEIISFDTVLPKSTREVHFSVKNAGAGNYRLDVYAWAVKSKLIGASNIFNGPNSKKFLVLGTKENKAQIFREVTLFGGVIGPVGFPVQKGTEFKGAVAVVNKSLVEKSNLKMGIKICEWASAFCESEEKFFPVQNIPAGESIVVQLEGLKAPNLESAYEIMITLYSANNVESIYKSRVIVSGGTAKARKVFVSGLEKEEYSINAIISGSPDHFNNPDFAEFIVSAKLYSLGKEIESKTTKVALIKTNEIIQREFLVNSKDFDRVCVLIEKQNIEYDKECFDIDVTSVQKAYNEKFPKLVDVKWNYDETTEQLSITLEKEKINAQVRVFNSNETILFKQINAEKQSTLNMSVEKQNLTLAVDDFDAKRQQVFTLNLALPEDKRENVILGESEVSVIGEEAKCEGFYCDAGLICEGGKGTQNECCYTKCIQASSIESENILGIPLILIIALILLVLTIVVVYETIKAVRK